MADEADFQEISLDTTLDDIEDLPSFGIFPSGAYHIVLDKGLEWKKMNEGKDNAFNAITVNMRLVEVAEVDPKMLDKGEELPKVGDVASLLFNLSNKWGAGELKVFSAPIATQFFPGQEKVPLRGILENSVGLNLVVVLQRTFDKEKQRHYQKCVKVAVI